MDYKEKASERIEKYREDIVGISKQIHAEPELGHQEYKSSKLVVDELVKHGYKIEYGVSGMETAFIARKGEGSPKIGILAEYDCLPGIGHACGHNLIAASALGAGIGLAELIEEIGGEVIVFGTPAEEGVVQNAGGKVVMID
ncbi:MAG: amidohydrolase, partial [Candidatus Bathyarchaeota archaeon]|nr:amidohydrolase [Candidatus Bathyarchaeota archaeon]